MKVVKGINFHLQDKYQGCNVQHDDDIRYCMILHRKGAPKSSHDENFFLCFLLYLYKMMDVK